MNTKGVFKRVAFLGMLFAGGMGYAQSNHWKEHAQASGVTDADELSAVGCAQLVGTCGWYGRIGGLIYWPKRIVNGPVSSTTL